MRGKVRSFDQRNGWGFVDGEDGRDYFLHSADLAKSHIPVVRPGDQLEFNGRAEYGRQTLRAVNLKVPS